MTWVIVAIIVVSVGVTAYLGVKHLQAQQQLIRALEVLANVLQKWQRPSAGSDPVAPTTEATPTAMRAVPELPLEIIAHNLAKPPRSRGGFGSVVRTDDDLQIRPTDRSETGSESCETGSGEENKAAAGPSAPDQQPTSTDTCTPAFGRTGPKK